MIKSTLYPASCPMSSLDKTLNTISTCANYNSDFHTFTYKGHYFLSFFSLALRKIQMPM